MHTHTHIYICIYYNYRMSRRKISLVRFQTSESTEGNASVLVITVIYIHLLYSQKVCMVIRYITQ